MKKIVDNFSDLRPIPYLKIVNFLNQNPKVKKINTNIKRNITKK